jgi:hypothetical protein
MNDLPCTNFETRIQDVVHILSEEPCDVIIAAAPSKVEIGLLDNLLRDWGLQNPCVLADRRRPLVEDVGTIGEHIDSASQSST